MGNVMKTTRASFHNRQETWVHMDAEGQILGRFATEVATLLRGKHLPNYTPDVDMGVFVVVTNAGKVKVTGKKLDQKVYYRHSGRPGGLKTETLRERLDKHPERAMEAAVRGMLPKNKLGRQIIKHLKVYAGPEHPHQAQLQAGKKEEKAS